MRSLRADLDRPAIDAFLSAADAVMNSNTLLLKARSDAPLNDQNAAATLGSFLEDPLFLEMMLAADRIRGWYNLQEHVPETGGFAAGGTGSLVRGSGALTLDRLDAAGFADRLVWMLCDSSSPYRRHLGRERAKGLVEAFMREVLDPGSRPVTGDGARSDWSRTGWSFVSVRPDFLCSTGYHTGEPPEDPAYFDGGDSDTASLFYRDDVFYLLLTNGSP
ncbi:hypothetical protein [Actinomadura sp. HBU206391]|uniref:hypothetical protein n=1 Tax=Actinomadura sp. HBU206391 TaxID=2731692 RepID=UPI0016509DD2|nr:hypothetical protein [Actinomadura sp. HBU206391]MBC6459171.1 hypothetical protein [Actinomadura sp. HBU206391]